MPIKTNQQKRHPKRVVEEVPTDVWFPIARTLTHRCCRCGLAHVFRLRVRSDLEMLVDTNTKPLRKL